MYDIILEIGDLWGSCLWVKPDRGLPSHLYDWCCFLFLDYFMHIHRWYARLVCKLCLLYLHECAQVHCLVCLNSLFSIWRPNSLSPIARVSCIPISPLQCSPGLLRSTSLQHVLHISWACCARLNTCYTSKAVLHAPVFYPFSRHYNTTGSRLSTCISWLANSTLICSTHQSYSTHNNR